MNSRTTDIWPIIRALQTEGRLYKPSVRWLIIVGILASTLAAQRARCDTPSELAQRAAAVADEGRNEEAIRLATEAINQDPQLAAPYKTRGRELFRAGKVAESVADFDKYVALEPRWEARQWERGIALYYAGRYDDGAAQFERYQTFDGHDVENSVWRFLCMAPKTGIERAQAQMLPIENDRRVPMSQVYELFRGKTTPEAVLAAAGANPPSEAALAGRLFYAHLYLGLWFDANGKLDKARRYIDLAADQRLRDNPHLNRYMWDVARIHQQKLRK